MAKNAEKLIKSNKLDHIITVIQSSVEDLNLDCGENNVDIIISEWMG